MWLYLRKMYLKSAHICIDFAELQFELSTFLHACRRHHCFLTPPRNKRLHTSPSVCVYAKNQYCEWILRCGGREFNILNIYICRQVYMQLYKFTENMFVAAQLSIRENIAYIFSPARTITTNTTTFHYHPTELPTQHTYNVYIYTYT